MPWMITDRVHAAKKKIAALPGVRRLEMLLQLLDDVISEAVFDIQQSPLVVDTRGGNGLRKWHVMIDDIMDDLQDRGPDAV